VKRVGAASEGNLRRGDVIKEVNEVPTPYFQNFYDKYQELTAAKMEKVLLTVKHSGNTKYILLKVDYRNLSDIEGQEE